MWEKYYLLDLGDLIDGDKDIPEKDAAVRGTIEKMEALLDKERLLKYRQKRNGRGALQSLGAGALLQLAVFEYENRPPLECAVKEPQNITGAELQRMTPGEMLKRMPECERNEAREIRYRYGAQGKPYFEEIPLFFSLSHSDRAVFLAVSETEIGADIQNARKADWEKLAERFYGEADRERLAGCGGAEETEREFYRIWTRKEAYGKLTGEGVTGVLQKEIPGGSEGISWNLKELELEREIYYLAVCKESIAENQGTER